MARNSMARNSKLWGIAGGLLVGFIGWSAALPVLTRLDLKLMAPVIAPGSLLGWTLRIIAVLSAPVVISAFWLVIALILTRMRFLRLAGLIVLTTVGSELSQELIKLLFARKRPPSGLAHTITYLGFSYPSGHMVTIVASAGLIAAIGWVLRVKANWLAIPIAMVIIVAINRWAIGAHWVSDLIGGILLGGCCFVAALAVVPLLRVPADLNGIVLIYQPKQLPPRWTQLLARGATLAKTTPSAPGGPQAQQALLDKASRVIVAGGDGTIRQVAEVLVDTQITLGILPMGTGNVLASALGIPHDITSAMQVALQGTPYRWRVIDPIVNHHRVPPGLTMLGVGADGRVVANTSAVTKKLFGALAYALAGFRQLKPKEFVIDGTLGCHQIAQLVVTNVPGLRRWLVFAPDANPEDDYLDFMLVQASSRVHVWAIMFEVIGRKPPSSGSIPKNQPTRSSRTVLQAKIATCLFDPPTPLQIDGDPIGLVTKLQVGLGGELLIAAPNPKCFSFYQAD